MGLGDADHRTAMATEEFNAAKRALHELDGRLFEWLFAIAEHRTLFSLFFFPLHHLCFVSLCLSPPPLLSICFSLHRTEETNLEVPDHTTQRRGGHQVFSLCRGSLEPTEG